MKKELDPKTALFEASRSMTAAIMILKGKYPDLSLDLLPDRVREAIAYLGSRRDVAEDAARSIVPRKSETELIHELRLRILDLEALAGLYSDGNQFDALQLSRKLGLDPADLTPSGDGSKK